MSKPVYEFDIAERAQREGLKGWAQAVKDCLLKSGYSRGGFTGCSPRSGHLDGEGGFLAMLHPSEVEQIPASASGGSGTLRAAWKSLAASLHQFGRYLAAQLKRIAGGVM